MSFAEDIERLAWPGEAELDVWRMHLAPAPTAISGLQAHLSPEEHSKANRFHFERDRLRYTAAHAGMRLILAAYLGCRPAHVAIAAGPHGKPVLVEPAGRSVLAFNLSHSGEEGLLAVGRQQYIGVDIEQERSMSDLQHIAGSVLSKRELALFRDLHPDQQLESFFRIWTRKEAVVKATGAGLATALQEVRIEPAEPAEHARFEAVGAMPDGRRLHGLSFTPVAGYHAAAVTEIADFKVTWHHWSADQA